ncbi:MAG: SCP2 sterol-binding domain-containing protein [Syntrophaceae bacterium]
MAEYFGSKVEDIFNTMPARFLPQGVAGVDVVIGYDISGEGGGRWTVTIRDATLAVAAVAELPKCSVVLISDPETFVGSALGKIDAAEAFGAGKIKFTGDITAVLNVLPKAFSPFKPVVRAGAIIESMPERFKPEKAEGVNLKIGYDLSGADGGAWTMLIKDGTCTLKNGLDSDCTVTMRMAADVFVGLNTGKIDPAAAFGGGQVKIEGDIMAAGTTAKLFGKFEAAGAQEKKGEELISLKCIPTINQRFATGTHMGKWFAGLKDKRIVGTRCPQCHRVLVPPSEVCAICRVRTDDFVEVGPKATVCQIDTVYYASPDPLSGQVRHTPYAGAYMVFDGGTPYESFAMEINPKDMDRIKPGMKVRPVWNTERSGTFTDLLYFEIDD